MSSAEPAEVGSTANSYEILAKLAEGGMAEIFLARGASVAGLSRHVVLKRVLRDRATDANFIRMFLDEARLAAQLQHPNIAQVYDIGKLGDSYFFTMEYVHGETVRALLQRAAGLRKPVPIPCALAIIAGSAAGLHHAHERNGMDGQPLGIVHRDVSPSNLMVSYEGHVKVVDFGVAKAANRLQETRSGTVKGKISYLSPEQCRGASVDRRSDLFSLGIVMWELLALERLYRRTSDYETMTAIVQDAVPPPSSRRSDISPELDEIVLRLLAKSPDDRFQTADEVLEAIGEVAARTGSSLMASTVARFVRDLFGQRPEPWAEVDDDHRAVTVTSEPIPIELALVETGAIDQRLAGVVDLSGRVTKSGPIETSQLRRPASAPIAEPTDSRAVRESIAGDTVPFVGPTQQMDVPTFEVPVGAPTEQIASVFVEPEPAPPRRRVPRALLVALPVLALGVIAITLSMRGGTEPARPAEPRIETLVVTPTPPVDAPPAVTAPPIDAAPAELGTPGPVDPRGAIAAAVAGGRFDDAFAACSANPAIADKGSVDCAVAACRAKNAAKARRWLQPIASAKRAPVVAACQASRTALEVARPRPNTIDCTKHPMDCQR